MLPQRPSDDRERREAEGHDDQRGQPLERGSSSTSGMAIWVSSTSAANDARHQGAASRRDGASRAVRRGRRLLPRRAPGTCAEHVVVRRPRSGRGSGSRGSGRRRCSGPTPAAASRCPGRPTAYSSRARAISNAHAASTNSGVTGARPKALGAEPPQVLLGQVDPAAVEVLVHVAQEVRQLEGVAELPGVARARSGVVRLEDRQHHLADHRGRPVHVAEQVVPGLVGLDGEVHGHRAQEPAEAVGVDVEGPDRVDHGLQHRVVGVAALEVGEEAVAEVGERPWPARRSAHVAEVVDDVVGVAAEPVQGVHVVALDRRAAA